MEDLILLFHLVSVPEHLYREHLTYGVCVCPVLEGVGFFAQLSSNCQPAPSCVVHPKWLQSDPVAEKTLAVLGFLRNGMLPSKTVLQEILR